jgi:hypothetical protein
MAIGRCIQLSPPCRNKAVNELAYHGAKLSAFVQHTICMQGQLACLNAQLQKEGEQGQATVFPPSMPLTSCERDPLEHTQRFDCNAASVLTHIAQESKQMRPDSVVPSQSRPHMPPSTPGTLTGLLPY